MVRIYTLLTRILIRFVKLQSTKKLNIMPWKELLGLGSGILNGIITDHYNEKNASRNQAYWERQLGLTYNANEKAADNAMKRSLNMYNLTQSPEAMVKQLKAAGLNPALMYSNGGMGGHTTNGAQGGVNGANGAPNALGLQTYIDPLTMAQIANIDADTRKKESETELTKSQKQTQDLITEFQKLENDFNKENYGYRVQKFIAETTSAVEQANIDRINGKISEETYDEQIELIGQNLLIAKAKESLLKSQKNLTDKQINEVLQRINLMSAQIWEISSKAELNQEELTQLVNNREWNYLSIEDAKWIVEQSIDVLKEMLNLIPIGRVKTLITKIIRKKEGNTTTITKTQTKN